MKFCPICETQTPEFEPHNGRPGRRCPGCRSLGRQRLAWEFLKRETDLFEAPPSFLLHLAPEKALEPRLATHPAIHYLSGDLGSPRALVKMDLMEMPFRDDTFDAILCSHVLEHVADDRKALGEMHRVLRPGGWALIQIPVPLEVTDEDPSVTTPEARLERFGQDDHVRTYGKDVVDRMSGAGFSAQALDYRKKLGKEYATRLGVGSGQQLYFCQKPARQ